MIKSTKEDLKEFLDNIKPTPKREEEAEEKDD